MPGMLQVQAALQTASLVIRAAVVADIDATIRCMKVRDVAFRNPVLPGDSLDISVDMEKIGDRFYRASFSAMNSNSLKTASGALDLVFSG
jgi:3-hydroxymyristoyl/3-hydroxydecanoyl-(acyl carrier protein) dehydratase